MKVLVGPRFLAALVAVSALGCHELAQANAFLPAGLLSEATSEAYSQLVVLSLVQRHDIDVGERSARSTAIAATVGPVEFAGVAFADAWSTESFLHAHASASAAINIFDEADERVYEVGADAVATATWSDWFALVGDDVAIGDMVPVEFGYRLHLIGRPGSFNDDVNRTSTSVTGQVSIGPYGGFVAHNAVPLTTFVLELPAFTAIRLSQSLNLGASASRRRPPDGGASTSIDAFNTAAVGFRVLQPGVSYETASGVDYSQVFSTDPGTVPEPTTLLLLTVGGGALFVFRRRQQGRVRGLLHPHQK